MVKRKPRALTRDTRQTGSSDIVRDRQRKALAPGKRRSKRGNIYFENRKNRSDVKGRDTPMTRRKRTVRSVKANSIIGDSVLRKRVIIGATPSRKMMIQDVTPRMTVLKRKQIEASVKRLDKKLSNIRTRGFDREPLRGVRRHALLPLALRKSIPKLYATENIKDKKIAAKFFSPYSNFTYYVVEFDGKDTMFGYNQNGTLGYSSFKEMVTANRNGLPLIERDKYFTPKKWSMVRK